MSLLAPLEASSFNSNGNDSKYYKIKKVVSAITEYLQTRAEDTGMVVNRYLQALSVTIDLSIFDPHTNIAAEFFVSLYELMNKIDQRSSFAWYCVDVLANICRNPSTRHALIHTYNFLPPLSRLLGDQLTAEKKIRLLKLLQDLSCGIKISWQIPHLPHLMSTLTKWVESQDEEIVTLSLAVLVNLCYKNLPAVYTLSTNVDIKRFFRVCMPLQGPIIEVHTCKLIIILDYMNGDIPRNTIMKLIDATFNSMIEAFNARDPILLRQIVEFYLDIQTDHRELEKIKSYSNYEDQIKRLIVVLENKPIGGAGNACSDSQDPECMGLVFQFLHSIVELNLPLIKGFYPKFIQLAMNWIETDMVSSQALAILRTIAIKTGPEDGGILEPLGGGLPVFLACLNTGNQEEFPTHIEHNKKLGALLQLLKSMVKVAALQMKVLQALREESVYKVFIPLIGDSSNDSPRVRANDADTYSIEAINLYIYGISLVYELSKINANWNFLLNNLMQHRQIHMIMAQALYSCPKEVKSLVLDLAGLEEFPKESVATAMGMFHSTVAIETSSNKGHNGLADLNFPVLSVSQIERLDDVIGKLKEAVADRNLINISTSDVMELYEYKLASMAHAERAAMASVEAASERCTHLQHRTAQLNAELNRLHQLLFHTQQCHEQAAKARDTLAENFREVSNKYDAEKGRIKVIQGQLKVKEKALAECAALLEDTSTKLINLTEAKTQLDEKHAKLQEFVAKLEDNGKKLEKSVQKREETIRKNSVTIDSLKMQLREVESSLRNRESELQQRNNELQMVEKELAARKHIIETITKVAASQHNI